MTVVDGAAPVIHSPPSPKKLTPNVGISTTTTIPTSKNMSHKLHVRKRVHNPKSNNLRVIRKASLMTSPKVRKSVHFPQSHIVRVTRKVR